MEKDMLIMMVEDDQTLARELQEYLQRWGYRCVIATHFDNIFQEYHNYRPHLILMDINLPYYDGFYWCHAIRTISEVPILFISSRSDDKDKIMGMAQGGDDFVEKPFQLELLKAKIEAILRRAYQYKIKDRIQITQNLYYEDANQSLYHRNIEIELTKSEKRIMATLLNARNSIITRDELMMELWNTDEFVSDGTLTTVISRLRSKLKQQCDEELICTKKGMGYYIK